MGDAGDPHFDSVPELWEQLKPLARQMRHEPTLAETALWKQLRGRQLCNAKLRCQHAIDRFIVDFCCLEANLIVEVDGEVHDYTVAQDQVRQAYLETLGFTVLRFSNDHVLSAMAQVLQRIGDAVLTRTNTDGK